MTLPRSLIVNADDFGLCRGVNRGIIETVERGIVTSASLMVRQPAAAEAAACARQNQNLSVGLHLDLGEWIYQNGDWVRRYEVVPADNVEAVKREVDRQLAAFRELMGRDPTHLNSHQHAHRKEPVRSIALAAARELSIPLRECDSRIRFCGGFYGQTGEGEPLPDGIRVAGLKKILAALPEGVTELGCHPGYVEGLSSVYRREREREIQTLCHPEIPACLRESHIELCRFDDLPRLRRAAPQAG
jgi:chitin disaccharide deacetylase